MRRVDLDVACLYAPRLSSPRSLPGQIAVRQLREELGLRKEIVLNSPEPLRRGGYIARRTR